MTLSIEEFPDFVKAVHDQAPFPWQMALLRRVVAGEGWPGTVRAPTGSGKTLALDVAVWHLAMVGAAAPRRLFWVVDRRLVADQVHERAMTLARALAHPRTGLVRRVAEALKVLDPTAESPLDVRLWRGGMWLDDGAPPSPAQPAVVVSTVDQVGSRLLFRGYGVSPSMAPVHAGLVGMDSLILLDEAHIAIPFAKAVEAVDVLQSPTWCRAPLAAPRPVRLVRLSATGDDPEAPALIGPADHDDPVLGPRLAARKPARLVEVKGEDLPAMVAERAIALIDGEVRRVAAVVNTVGTARAVHRLIAAQGIDTVLLTGRMRPVDRDAILADWQARLETDPRRDRAAEPPCVVVATQAIEVGVDFDLDGLVSEAAPLAALAQRAGRVDRLGQRRTSPLVLVCPSERLGARAKPDPVYGKATAETWTWLKERAVAPPPPRRGKGPSEPVIDLGWPTLDGVTTDDWHRLAVAVQAYEPLDSVMAGLFARTRPRPVPDPDPALFLHGRGGEGEVQVVWRADLDRKVLEAPGRAAAIVAACPPLRGEALTLPVSATRRWLARSAEGEDALADTPVPPPDRRVGGGRPALAWEGPDDSRIVHADGLRPGLTLVVPAAYGGIDPRSLTWNPDSDPDPKATAKLDIAEAARLAARRPLVLRVHPDIDPDHSDALLAAAIDDDGDLAEDAIERIRVALAARDEEPLPADSPWWVLLSDERDGWTVTPYDPNSPKHGLILREPKPEEPTTDGDASLAGEPVSLFRHLAGVAATATEQATACGLSGAAAEAVRWSALLHDSGKVEPRFQAWLHGGDRVAAAGAQDPLAKGQRLRTPAERKAARERAGLPKGVRHEDWSLALASRVAMPDGVRELALWLVATHHGHGRPLPPVPPPGAATSLTLRWPDGPVLEADPGAGGAAVGAGWPGLFDRLTTLYGPWGLAWLEAVIRLSDGRRSALERRNGAAPTDTLPPIVLAVPVKEARHELPLEGLRADTLAGFLAGLGTLRLLSGAWPDDAVRLAWGTAFPHAATLSATRPLDRSGVLDALDAALARDIAAFPIFKERGDVGFAPTELRDALENACKDGDRHAAAWLRAFATATGWNRDPNAAEVTPFVMLGAGQTNFLKAVRALARAVGRTHLERALFKPWDYADSGLDSLRWDPEDAREHAYTLHDPAAPAAWKGNEPRRMAGANRLALAALPCLPVVPVGSRPRATATRRLDNALAFVWPVWSEPADLATACAMLSASEVVEPGGTTVRPGLATVLHAIRAAAGRYPIVLPARPLLPVG